MLYVTVLLCLLPAAVLLCVVYRSGSLLLSRVCLSSCICSVMCFTQLALFDFLVQYVILIICD